MNIRTQVIIAVLIVIALLVILNMVRKKALELRYTLTWLFMGVGILILDICPGIMEKLAAFMGIGLPVNMLFFLGFCFTLVIIFGMTSAISKMSVQIKLLAQELALHEKREGEQDNEKKGTGEVK